MVDLDVTSANEVFDIASLDTEKASEAGATLFLLHPGSRRPLKDAKGDPIFWKVIGKHSAAYTKVSTRLRNKNLKEMQGQGPRSTVEELDENTLELLSATVVGWSDNFIVDGAHPAFSVANVKRILTDSRFRWLREQLDAFVGDIGNFLSD